MTRFVMLKRPSGFIPVAMSTVALVAVLTQLALHGAAPQADEGAEARIWQLMMAGQLPIMLFFLGRWVSQSPKEAGPVFALQVLLALAAMAPVFLLGW